METNTRTTHGRSPRFSLVGGLRGFLAAAGLAGAMATVAIAQSSGTNRAAGLLPPRPLDAGEAVPLARGAFPDAPTSATTPIPRPYSKAPLPVSSPPAWLTGVDPNVLPAAGNTSTNTAGNKSAVMNAGPLPSGIGSAANRAPQPAIREQATPGKGIERFKTGTSGERSANDPNLPPDLPNASTPFRGTTRNGLPVYAGPPAYRWYGYGAVTPGANPYAPSGLYPKASANWYNVTGATPGAFPVPVTNPQNQPPGIDPPSYATSPNARNMGVTPTTSLQPFVSTPPPVPTPTMPLITTTPGPVPAPANLEPPRMTPPVSVMMPPPVLPSPISASVRPEVPAIPAPPVGIPTIALPPALGPAAPLQPVPIKPKEAVPAGPASPASPTALAPPLGVIPPLGPIEPVALPVQPSPMPLTATKPAGEELKWQPGESPGKPEGTWAPAIGQPVISNQPGALRPVQQLLIRAQMADERIPADPSGDLIRELCRGRAKGIEVRWTGPKHVSLCFETPTEPEAARLVTDISARRELASLQIDFCVLVK